jgi:hypothetical protein
VRWRHLEQVVRRGGDGRAARRHLVGPAPVDDEVAGIVGIGRDISNRKRLEHELEAMAHGLRELGEVSDLGMYRFSFDADGAAVSTTSTRCSRPGSGTRPSSCGRPVAAVAPAPGIAVERL